jgi:hypothetical protein
MCQTIRVRGNGVGGSDNVGVLAWRRVIERREDVHDEAAEETAGASDEDIAAGQLTEHIGNRPTHVRCLPHSH